MSSNDFDYNKLNPDDFWPDAEKMLDQHFARKRFWWRTGISLSALVLIGGMVLGLFYFLPSNKAHQQLVDSKQKANVFSAKSSLSLAETNASNKKENTANPTNNSVQQEPSLPESGLQNKKVEEGAQSHSPVIKTVTINKGAEKEQQQPAQLDNSSKKKLESTKLNKQQFGKLTRNANPNNTALSKNEMNTQADRKALVEATEINAQNLSESTVNATTMMDKQGSAVVARKPAEESANANGNRSVSGGNVGAAGTDKGSEIRMSSIPVMSSPLLLKPVSAKALMMPELTTSTNGGPAKAPKKPKNYIVGVEVYGGGSFSQVIYAGKEEVKPLIDLLSANSKPAYSGIYGANVYYQYKMWKVKTGVEQVQLDTKVNFQLQPMVSAWNYSGKTVYDSTTTIDTVKYINNGVPHVDYNPVSVLDTLYNPKFDSTLTQVPGDSIYKYQGVNALRYLEVPLELGFVYPFGRWELGVNGGVSILVPQKSSLVIYQKELSGFEAVPSSVLNKMVYNARLSLQLNYGITPAWSVFARSQVKMQLNSAFNTEYYLEEKFKGVTFTVGVAYKFGR